MECSDCRKPITRHSSSGKCPSCSRKGKKPKNFEHFSTFNRNRLGTNLSAEHKKKLSKIAKKKGIRPPDRTGIPMSEETKRKIGEANYKGGGKTANIHGYNRKSYGKAGRRKRMLEHRRVMERHLGRKLQPEEHVHHINHDKTDNRIENLMLFANANEHAKYHAKTN